MISYLVEKMTPTVLNSGSLRLGTQRASLNKRSAFRGLHPAASNNAKILSF